MFVQLRHSQLSPTAVIGTIIAWPIRAVLAGIEWILVEVVARIIALPLLLLLAIIAHIQVARVRYATRVEEERARKAGRILAATVAAQTYPFRQALAEIECLDARHAQLDPHFAQSLAAAQLVFDNGIGHIQEVVVSHDLRSTLSSAFKID